MKKILSTGMIAALGMFASAASASTTQENVALCVAALDSQGIASSADYAPKFKGSRGGGLKKVTLLLTPLSGDGDRIEAICSIKRGEVVDIAVKN